MSDYEKIHNDLTCEGYTHKIATSVVVMIALNHAQEIKLEDVYKPNAFTERLEKKFKEVLWQLDEKEFEICHALWKVHHDYTIGETMNGLGGCTKKTYKQLLEEINEI